MAWKNVSKKEKVVKEPTVKEPRLTITILKGGKNATLSADLVQRLGKPENVAVVVDEENRFLGVSAVMDGDESVKVHYTKVDEPTGVIYCRFASEALGITAADGALVGNAIVADDLGDIGDGGVMAYIKIDEAKPYSTKPKTVTAKKSTKKSAKK